MSTAEPEIPMGEWREILETARLYGLPPATAPREPIPPPVASILARASTRQLEAFLALGLLRKLTSTTPEEQRLLKLLCPPASRMQQGHRAASARDRGAPPASPAP